MKHWKSMKSYKKRELLVYRIVHSHVTQRNARDFVIITLHQTSCEIAEEY